MFGDADEADQMLRTEDASLRERKLSLQLCVYCPSVCVRACERRVRAQEHLPHIRLGFSWGR